LTTFIDHRRRLKTSDLKFGNFRFKITDGLSGRAKRFAAPETVACFEVGQSITDHRQKGARRYLSEARRLMGQVTHLPANSQTKRQNQINGQISRRFISHINLEPQLFTFQRIIQLLLPVQPAKAGQRHH